MILAAPPLDTLDLLRDLGGPLRRFVAAGGRVTDVASTKGAIVALAGELGLRFVGGHPMAGREVTGFKASDAGLFVDRPWVVVPIRGHGRHVAHRGDRRRLRGADGCVWTPDEHDRLVAAISHLPLVLSAALVEAVAGGVDRTRADWAAASALAAGGWDSMTRLARGDVEWARASR